MKASRPKRPKSARRAPASRAPGTTPAAAPPGAEVPASRTAAIASARAALDKKATEIVVLDVSQFLVVTDYFVIASVASAPQARAVADAVEEVLDSAGLRRVGRERDRDDSWILLDYGDVVVHVFRAEQRDYYSLEHLWEDAPKVDWE
ncbi:MAG: ribosome silencing factor [Planctomycetales bacterium]|nr:ribosome silencing factor [Planctomycetales bacterium]